MNYTLTPLGDASIVIQLGEEIDTDNLKTINAITSRLEKSPFPGMVECIPAYTTLTIFYDPVKAQFSQNHKTVNLSPYQFVAAWIEEILCNLSSEEESTSTVMHIPVCYGGEYGPDLGFVAAYNGLTETDVIRIHSSGDYLVYMIGFAPGFPYVGGMSDEIATPRRASPRLSIPPGSVGIAGIQTGVYPIEAPGGWQLIGQTPVEFFRPYNQVPSLLSPGNAVRFYPISEEEFRNWQEEYHAF